jgi:hypothetical protein
VSNTYEPTHPGSVRPFNLGSACVGKGLDGADQHGRAVRAGSDPTQGWIQLVVATLRSSRRDVVAQGKTREAIRAGRPPLRSPGRPPVNRRKEQRLFWQQITEGLPSAEATVARGVSMPLGPRWFREAGGIQPIILDPPSREVDPDNRCSVLVTLSEQGGKLVDEVIDEHASKQRDPLAAKRRPAGRA